MKVYQRSINEMLTVLFTWKVTALVVGQSPTAATIAQQELEFKPEVARGAIAKGLKVPLEAVTITGSSYQGFTAYRTDGTIFTPVIET